MHKNTGWLDLWPGFHVTDSRITHDSAWLRLEPLTKLPLRCGQCLGLVESVHERVTRNVRELSLAGRTLTLQVQLLRVNCTRCGHCLQHVRWLDRFARMTRAMAQAVAQCCKRLPIKHVAQMFCLHWSTVQQLDKRSLAGLMSQLPQPQPTHLVMDEFALHKGHRYASVILDADTRRVLYIAKDRSREAIRPFFEALGEAGCRRIQAVAMDMNTAFDLEVRHWCPRARIVYDLFHVIAKYGREVISRVRVDTANALRNDKPARRVVKQAHWLLLRNADNLKDSEQVTLQEVLEANEALMTVYVLKQSLKSLWTAIDPWQWRQRWKQWLAHCAQSGIECLQLFANRLRKYWPGILARVRWPMHTGQLEGINNRIKVIKRMAYGYRDVEYFFLKIKAAFPGNA